MSRSRLARIPAAIVLAGLTVAMAGCSTWNPFGPSAPSAPQPMPLEVLPPAFPPQDIIGSWGLAAYHKDEDRSRIEVEALNQCKQPYVITLGPTGGVMMHLADQPTPTELRLKGAPGKRTFIGPDGEAGGQQDREVVGFDGRVLALKWLDPEVQSRYGTMVYVRCPPEGTKKPKPKVKPRPKTAPKTVQPPIQRQ